MNEHPGNNDSMRKKSVGHTSQYDFICIDSEAPRMLEWRIWQARRDLPATVSPQTFSKQSYDKELAIIINSAPAE